jgi:hypothetical protein
MLQIEGTKKGAYLENVTKFDNEFEVLLPRGTKYEVLGIDRSCSLGSTGKFKHTVIRVRAVNG